MIEMIEPAVQTVELNPVTQPLVVQQRAVSATPAELLRIAVEQGANVEQLERLMALQERWEANEARRAYNAAMAEFKKNPPTIYKDKHVYYEGAKGPVSYDHATLGHECEVIVKALAQHDITHRWDTKQEGDRIIVTCILRHKAGHEERTTLQSGADASGGKNSIQAIGSAVRYLQRYTLESATGLAPNDITDDDDGAAAGEQADAVLQGFRDAALNGEAALRKHYAANLPTEDFWKTNGKALKEAAKAADAKGGAA